MISTIFRSKVERWTLLCDFSDVKCSFYDSTLFSCVSSALYYPFLLSYVEIFSPMNFVMMMKMEQWGITSDFPFPINHRWLLELLCSLIEFICSTSYITYILWLMYVPGSELHGNMRLMSFRTKILKLNL